MKQNDVTTMEITSDAFSHQERIPRKYTCDGENINPSLHIGNLPEGTKSLVLLMDDPDAPIGTFDHWIVWNIPPQNEIIEENSIPGVEGLNSFNQHHYGGPCPPSGDHRYYFKIYALDTMLNIPASSGKQEVEKAMEGHVLGQGELVGLYQRG